MSKTVTFLSRSCQITSRRCQIKSETCLLHRKFIHFAPHTKVNLKNRFCAPAKRHKVLNGRSCIFQIIFTKIPTTMLENTNEYTSIRTTELIGFQSPCTYTYLRTTARVPKDMHIRVYANNAYGSNNYAYTHICEQLIGFQKPSLSIYIYICI